MTGFESSESKEEREEMTGEKDACDVSQTQTRFERMDQTKINHPYDVRCLLSVSYCLLLI